MNFVDELSQCPELMFSQVAPKFNSTKFYNLLQTLELCEVIDRFTMNLALLTELIYFQKFLGGLSVKKWSYMISLMFKKLCVFALVWIEKEKASQISPLLKKLT